MLHPRLLLQAALSPAFPARLSEPMISCVAVWKQLHLNQWYAETKRPWEMSQTAQASKGVEFWSHRMLNIV
jgi:hypothetical protein